MEAGGFAAAGVTLGAIGATILAGKAAGRAVGNATKNAPRPRASSAPRPGASPQGIDAPARHRTQSPKQCSDGFICFIEGTQVKTDEGYENIEDIRVGDRVWSKDYRTGRTGFKRARNLFVTQPTILTHLFYKRVGGRAKGSSGVRSRGGLGGGDSDDDPDSSELIGTPIHPFWSVTRGQWIEMGELAVAHPRILAVSACAR